MPKFSIHTGGPGMKHSIDSLLSQLARRISKGGDTPELQIDLQIDR